MVNELNFSALSQTPDSAAEAAEENRLFQMEQAAENPPPTGAASQAAPVEVAQSSPSAESDPGEATASTAQTETAPESEDKPQAKEEEDETKAAEKTEDSSLSDLMRLAAGKVSSDEVQLSAVPPAKSMSAFQSLAASRRLDPDSEQILDDLVSTLSTEPEPVTASPAKPDVSRPSATAAKEQPSVQQQVLAQAPPMGGAAQLGELAGRAIAGTAAFPFMALSSAARHLTNRFQTPGGASPAAPAGVASSLQASKGSPRIPLPMANTLETITDWKCERIEKAGESVVNAAAELMETADFVTWEDELGTVANQRGVAAADVVREMHSNPDFAPLKEKMDRLWGNHPEKVSAYRDACDDFERNIRNVVKEFPNSEDQVKDRVVNAMKRVEEETKVLPGFGDKMGEYSKALAERVRELAQMIAEFVTDLMRRIGGKTRTSDLSM